MVLIQVHIPLVSFPCLSWFQTQSPLTEEENRCPGGRACDTVAAFPSPLPKVPSPIHSDNSTPGEGDMVDFKVSGGPSSHCSSDMKHHRGIPIRVGYMRTR